MFESGKILFFEISVEDFEDYDLYDYDYDGEDDDVSK